MDPEKVQKAKEVLVKEVRAVSVELANLENRRAVLLSTFLAENNFERDLNYYRNFKELTHSSILILDKFLDLYAQVMGYVLLLRTRRASQR